MTLSKSVSAFPVSTLETEIPSKPLAPARHYIEQWGWPKAQEFLWPCVCCSNPHCPARRKRNTCFSLGGGGSRMSRFNVCDSSEPGGPCPDANLKSSYDCIWERGVLKKAFGKTINLERKKKSAWHDKIFEILFIIFILKWTRLSPTSTPKEEKRPPPSQGRWVSLSNRGCLFLVRKEQRHCLWTMLRRQVFVKVLASVGTELIGTWHLEPWLEESGNSANHIWQNYFFFYLRIVGERLKCPLRNSKKIWIFNTYS